MHSDPSPADGPTPAFDAEAFDEARAQWEADIDAGVDLELLAEIDVIIGYMTEVRRCVLAGVEPPDSPWQKKRRRKRQ